MVRDGRATVHSIISRKVTITGFDLTNYRQCMQKWNQAITTMHDQCQEIGKERFDVFYFISLLRELSISFFFFFLCRCMMVHYEQLVLQPKKSMEKILEFLDIPWNESVLHHEDFINKENGVALSKWAKFFQFRIDFNWNFLKSHSKSWKIIWSSDKTCKFRSSIKVGR